MHQLSRWAWLIAGLASIGLATLAPADGPTDLGNEKILKYKKIRPTDLIPLLKGERQVQDSDKKNIELAAEVLVWRASWPLINTNSKNMDEVRKDFDEVMTALMDKGNRERNKDFRKRFAKNLVGCFKDVFNLPFDENRVGCVNAALLLPKLARIGIEEEEVGDFLADLVKDPKKHDAIKLYALKGLAAYFPAHEWTVAGEPASMQRKTREINRIKVIMDFLERTWDKGQVDDDAIRFLRREALKTLAQAQVPAVEVLKDKVVASVATGFLKVLDPKNGMKPPPSLQEKVEAAIGICQIKLIANSHYLPELGIYRVGDFLVDFANAYKIDKPSFTGASASKKIPTIPWKIQAERLTQALKVLVKNTDLSPGDLKNAEALLKESLPLLTAMQKHSDLENIPELRVLVNSFPKNTTIFKGIKPGNGD